MSIRKEDIIDEDFIEASELIATGLSNYVSGVTVVSTDTSTKRVVVSGFSLIHDDTRVEAGDKITLAGNAAAGVYTVANIIDDVTLDVVEAIVNSTGGTAAFNYVSGSKKVGFDPTGISITSATNVQDALKDVADNAVGISATTHRELRQLIHFISEGPAEGFATNAYKETLPSADPFPTSMIWWESAAKTQKIVSKTVSYNANKTPNTIEWKMYDTDGVSLLVTVTDTISYTAVFETSRTRAIV